jgi:hypothetical protein
MAAIISFLYRSYIYLKHGKWSISLCDLSIDVQERGGNIPNFCDLHQSSMIGLNRIIRSITMDYDSSFALMGIAFAILIVFLLFIIFVLICDKKDNILRF